jgi:polyhydroxyalkanoate synthesis regulator phasin
MASFDLSEGVRKFFLMGVGAVATGAEKSQEIVDDLVKKGELTVEQGKAMNEELTVRAKAASDDVQDEVIRTKLESMSVSEREAFLKHVSDIAADVDSKSCKVDVEVDAKDDASSKKTK